MNVYRCWWKHNEYPRGGWGDYPGESESEAIEQFWQFHDGEDITLERVEHIEGQHCKKCGQALGNLGLVYDECLNDACEMYLKDPRNH